MPQFKIFWKNNPNPEIVEGNSISDAFSKAGYGRGATSAVDYYEEIQKNQRMLNTARIIGKFQYCYASASGVSRPTKKLFFTTYISQETEYVGYEVEVDGKTFEFSSQREAVDYYNMV